LLHNKRYYDIIFKIIYVVGKLPYYVLAKKAEHRYPYFALIPFLDTIQMVQIAGLLGWFVIVLFVPLVNVVFGLYIYYKFSTSYENGDFYFWIVIISIIASFMFPIAAIIVLVMTYWLAFGGNEYNGICMCS
jgi:hypothetical protein